MKLIPNCYQYNYCSNHMLPNFNKTIQTKVSFKLLDKIPRFGVDYIDEIINNLEST